ncbi:MAG: hypothetical protein R3B71_00915 [Candidatus Gracilibacteria bacterium]|nr:hypothetical protein [Candidatus Peregrinibacteria bacterium]
MRIRSITRQPSKKEVLQVLARYLRVQPAQSMRTHKLELAVRSLNLNRLP